MSHHEESVFKALPPPQYKEPSAEALEADLYLRPQIKKSRNKGAWAMNVNM